MSVAATRRLQRELRLVHREPSWGVSAAPLEEDLYTWHCNVAGQPPSGGPPVILHLELTFGADYPVRPPRVEVLGSTVTHPNVFSTFICLDMLEGGEWAADEEKRRPYMGWSSAYSILAILRQLQTFFFEGDGTQWWKCPRCTLHNPMKSKRCEACDHGRGTLKAIGIEVEHMVGFECRCGHRHGGAQWPPFPQSVECDDAPVAAVLPEACAESSCVICLGHLDDEARGALKGAPAARPLAQLVDARGQVVCKHFFHLPCAKQLQSRFCPLCRTAFREVAALSDTPVIQRSRASYSSEPLCKEALVSMARLASWPLGVVIQMMSFLLRRERVGVAFAVPAWKEAAQAPVFWEAQEVQCFHEKTGPDEDVIGIGVLAQGRGRLATLTAHFDAISRTAWQGGLRKAAWKEPLSHWLPLFIHQHHADTAASLLTECLHVLAEASAQQEDSHIPPLIFQALQNRRVQAVDAIVAFPEMMHQLLKQVLYGDRHASLKLLKGYFVMHRLFLHCCDQWPEIRVAADMALKQFISSPEGRTKQATPWLAYILQLLTVSNVGWEEVKEAFLQEALAREVQFILPRYPSYCPSRPGESGEDQVEESSKMTSEWSIVASMLGSDRAGGGDAEQLTPEAFRGARRGWTCIAGAVRRGSSAFSVHIRSMPADSVIRIGWIRAEGGFEDGWGFHASECYGTACGWKAHEGRWQRYGTFFQEGDTITAMVQNGSMSFLKNGRNLGVAFHVPVTETLRPAVALRRRAEVFFLTLVRPAESPPYWSRVKAEYDKRYGFPAPEMSAALFDMFSEVHKIRDLPGHVAWPKFLSLLGFEELCMEKLQLLLREAFDRAKAQGYKQGGRRDHA
ncbi:Ubiquitin-conjugating enzyme E2 2 (E2 ubiquitin-conjugating enzyme 2) (Radiation sensitivity protein 6) (Ubiquitin carrier protein UBC2) (Ubiquitin-protein ligase UBC2) [Durusdinium trenchii]|uniref:Ubiquitin-conjugating enzyme E2 2 (E2 ubiquitin-conjugating enzyme 2) (Radiation sensitivity protein 6) (Ubiquitin carrier protein UBC2) (Ubiquitin-protein ligase UBC2) n=1 Tax=Durusdinium trenchii TaxID=1381693 RepID=A0ABP0M5H5_9DINO